MGRAANGGQEEKEEVGRKGIREWRVEMDESCRRKSVSERSRSRRRRHRGTDAEHVGTSLAGWGVRRGTAGPDAVFDACWREGDKVSA